ncbi:TetR/AcrR family transcriptional regulator [Tenacibaculum sp. HL-MS23]|uniref:TetR/AcrR family transcriptional regulator n=1 Tax=unclassified Tenacibaculum TaxID=2635139 RepID=UPI001C4E91BF|nr:MULTISPECIES: TetR/AcrR family transcriptional regulator [unclassified Tenacibaculum]QXP74722.1 TetR/AcrR family transcriptional regulator [Tenacibaculum sp. AHE14PA]QXP76233.1 TetR/AcrR family transcriptional regulator [Tenacibaculum sp. AHE15PA]WNW02766.1 TetR/AcrR family transcriptional regulator [Tenacibaculum sp. HL-MS23]
MARKKEYNEDIVVEKAMNLFWRNGYETTSMQMLEKEMGINKFSIYASFGNKHGLFLESLKNYKKKINLIFEDLKKSNNGIEDIKDFFYNSIKICSDAGNQNGCLVTNTYNEFLNKEDEIINDQMNSFMSDLKDLFILKLKINSDKCDETILKQANYLLLAKHGLAAASRVNSKKEIEDYIEMTFKNL